MEVEQTQLEQPNAAIEENVGDVVSEARVTRRTAFDWEKVSDRARCLLSLRDDRFGVDVMLATNDGGQECVHHTVMSGLGSTFTKIIGQQCNNKAATVSVVDVFGESRMVKKVVLDKLDKKGLRAFVDYAYRGRFELSAKDEVFEVLKQAEEYDVDLIVQACCMFVCSLVAPDNCVDMLLLGHRLKHDMLKLVARYSIQVNIGSVMKRGRDLGKLSFEQLKRILMSDALNTHSEYTVILTIVSWALQKQATDRYIRQKVSGLLKCVRYLRLSAVELDNANKLPVIKDSKRLVDMLAEWAIERRQRAENLDGNFMPCSALPLQQRPRIPHSTLFAYGGWKSGEWRFVRVWHSSSTHRSSMQHVRNIRRVHEHVVLAIGQRCPAQGVLWHRGLRRTHLHDRRHEWLTVAQLFPLIQPTH